MLTYPTPDSDLEAGLEPAEIDLLARRAARYSRRSEADPDETTEVVVFARGSTNYAVNLTSLREIRHLRAFTPIPGAARTVPGIFHYRGQLLSAHDLGAFMSDAPPETQALWVLIVDHGQSGVGLLADEVFSVESIASQSVRPVPVTLGDKSAGFLGVARGDLMIVNVTALLAMPSFFCAF